MSRFLWFSVYSPRPDTSLHCEIIIIIIMHEYD